jgi:hypothetical protein
VASAGVHREHQRREHGHREDGAKCGSQRDRVCGAGLLVRACHHVSAFPADVIECADVRSVETVAAKPDVREIVIPELRVELAVTRRAHRDLRRPDRWESRAERRESPVFGAALLTEDPHHNCSTAPSIQRILGCFCTARRESRRVVVGANARAVICRDSRRHDVDFPNSRHVLRCLHWSRIHERPLMIADYGDVAPEQLPLGTDGNEQAPMAGVAS